MYHDGHFSSSSVSSLLEFNLHMPNVRLCCPNAYNVEMGKYTICKRPFHIGHVQVHRKKYSRIERLPNRTKSNKRVNVFIMLFEMKCLSILESHFSM